MPKIDIAIPDKFLCKLTGRLMHTPVLAVDGNTYERQAIRAWIYDNDTSPLTGEELTLEDISDATVLKSQITEFRRENNLCCLAGFFMAAKYEDSPQLDQINFIDDYLKEKNNIGETALHMAAIKNRADAVEFLIKNGAEFDDRDERGDTALNCAASWGFTEIVEILLKNGAEPNAKNNINLTSLDLAACGEHEATIEMLLQNGATLKTEGWTELHCAVTDRMEGVVKVLLKMGANVDAKDTGGLTPLHQAVQDKNREIIKLLIEHGADIHSKNMDNKTPIDEACDEELREFMHGIKPLISQQDI